MRICELCQKEHLGEYGSGRFCSSQCAKSFSTASRRSEINQKVSKTLSGRKYVPVKLCVNCGEPATHATRCDDCHPWRGNLILFKKLGIDTKKRKLSECSDEAFDMLFDLYFNQNWSSTMFSDTLDILSNTLYWFFKKYGTSLRSMSDAAQIAYEEGRQQLPTSGFSRYQQQWHTSWDGKRVFLRSSYELEFAKQLDEQKIPYEVEFKRIPYKHPDGSIRTAIPDFFLPLTNEIVEIKSSWTLDRDMMRAKKEKYQKLGYCFRLILDKVDTQIF